ncbi:hypothetical protein MMC13_007688 [Lambiella insularis]|nr:hypothetical protein [Lambiella insularis]
MDTYTRHTLAAILPTTSGLSPIGAVATNWSRTPSAEQREAEKAYLCFATSSPLAEHILASQGIAAHEEYLAEVQAYDAAERRAREKEREKWLARRRAMEKLRGRLRGLLKKAC